MEINQITEKIIGCAIEVHKRLGPGLLESACEECLSYELKNNGLKIDRQVAVPVIYKEIKLECGYRIDILVENTVIIACFPHLLKRASVRSYFTGINFENGCPVRIFGHVFTQEGKFIG